MVSSSATTISRYLARLPPERRKVVVALRQLIRTHLPKGYEEAMDFGMIAYQVPLSRHPHTRNGKPLLYAALAAQKHHYSLYLTCAYIDEARSQRLRDAFIHAGKKIDMGRSCLRFKSLDDLDLAAIATEIASTSPADFIARYEASRGRAQFADP